MLHAGSACTIIITHVSAQQSLPRLVHAALRVFVVFAFHVALQEYQFAIIYNCHKFFRAFPARFPCCDMLAGTRK